jgi:hypothetical protein
MTGHTLSALELFVLGGISFMGLSVAIPLGAVLVIAIDPIPKHGFRTQIAHTVGFIPVIATVGFGTYCWINAHKHVSKLD